MVALHRQPRRVLCTIVRVPAVLPNVRRDALLTPSRRPSELLPWADPYIASLVSQLQQEVRRDRFVRRPDATNPDASRQTDHVATDGAAINDWINDRTPSSPSSSLRCDLDPPSPAMGDDNEVWRDAWRQRLNFEENSPQ